MPLPQCIVPALTRCSPRRWKCGAVQSFKQGANSQTYICISDHVIIIIITLLSLLCCCYTVFNIDVLFLLLLIIKIIKPVNPKGNQP